MSRVAVLLLISGVSGSGKDSVTDALCSLRSDVCRAAIADSLCDVVSAAFSVDRGAFVDRSRKDVPLPDASLQGMSPRALLQFFGTDLVRANAASALSRSPLRASVQSGSSFWAWLLSRRLMRTLSTCSSDRVVAVTDVRWSDEASELVHALSPARVIRVLVVRPEFHDTSRSSERAMSAVHESESLATDYTERALRDYRPEYGDVYTARMGDACEVEFVVLRNSVAGLEHVQLLAAQLSLLIDQSIP